MEKLKIKVRELEERWPLVSYKIGENWDFESEYFSEDDLDNWEYELQLKDCMSENINIEDNEVNEYKSFTICESFIMNLEKLNVEFSVNETLVFNCEVAVLISELIECVNELIDKVNEFKITIDKPSIPNCCYEIEVDDTPEEVENIIYEIEHIINDMITTVDYFILPEVKDYKNIYRIGSKRADYIESSIGYLETTICNILIDNCIYEEKIENVIEEIEYLKKIVGMSLKDWTNYVKRTERRNSSGYTVREQKKQNTISSIQNLKRQGFKQVEICSKLNLSKGLVSRYWDFVYLNGKWQHRFKYDVTKENQTVCEIIEIEI